MDVSNVNCYTYSISDLPFVDRRKKTLTNRVRRFVNNYYLIPLFILYLEFFAVIIPPIDSPIKTITKRNLYFLKGPIVIYKLVTTDFPHVLMGHFKEIAIVKKYALNIGQVPPENIVKALKDKESIRRIYRRVIESRGYNNTEIGGVAFLAYEADGPELRLYEIPSMNRAFSEKLHSSLPPPLKQVQGQGFGSPMQAMPLEDSTVEEFISLLTEMDNRELFKRVGIDENVIEGLIRKLQSDKPDKDQKMALIKDFIRAYDIHSESKYILSPYDFKSFLGSIDVDGIYIGLFHFHNNYMEPPSEVDIENSHTDRQIVLTLGDKGIVIYDIIKGKKFIYRGDLIS